MTDSAALSENERIGRIYESRLERPVLQVNIDAIRLFLKWLGKPRAERWFWWLGRAGAGMSATSYTRPNAKAMAAVLARIYWLRPMGLVWGAAMAYALAVLSP